MSWVFGYGSLMWRPGFSHLARRPALLRGYSRAFCRLSFRHRGTPEAPGMVAGLSPGGSWRTAAPPHLQNKGPIPLGAKIRRRTTG